jgi:cell division septation protein DedD
MLPDPNDRPTRQSRAPLPLRGITIGIAVVALALFGGLIGYTYFSHGGGVGGPVPLIKADPRPMKTAPDKPGGMEVPNQDKEIYARIDRDPRTPAPKVERLLPPPETPMARPRPPSAPAPLEPEIPTAPPIEPPPNAVEVPQPRAAAPAPAKPATPAPAPQQQASAPRAAAPAAPPPSASGPTRYRIQLAALRTSEDATREWDKMRRAHMDLLGSLTLNVVRADLGDRGTFYRIQAGPLADEQAAKDLCRRLAEKKVGCLVVRP